MGGIGGTAEALLARISGQPLPAIGFPSTSEQSVDLSGVERGVVYLYSGNPWSPEGGYDTPTLDEAQHLAFATHWSDFTALNCLAFGVSSQGPGDQRLTAEALGLGHPLLSDGARHLARELGLPTFTVESTTRYCRTTLVVSEGVVVRAFYPVTSATRSAAHAIAWMRRQGWA